ncbi:hypothetical protein [Scrofimicrobium canadense]|nr:hypothetical protein [Scrofimicrobium canadense]
MTTPDRSQSGNHVASVSDFDENTEKPEARVDDTKSSSGRGLQSRG